MSQRHLVGGGGGGKKKFFWGGPPPPPPPLRATSRVFKFVFQIYKKLTGYRESARQCSWSAFPSNFVNIDMHEIRNESDMYEFIINKNEQKQIPVISDLSMCAQYFVPHS
jgi:hypothetical protein